MGSQGAHPACLFLGVTMLVTVAATVLLCTAVLTNHWEVITINRPLLEALVDKQSSHSLTWLFGGIVAKVTVWEGQSSSVHADREGVRTLGRESRSVRTRVAHESLEQALDTSHKHHPKQWRDRITGTKGRRPATESDLSPNDEKSEYSNDEQILPAWPQMTKNVPENNSFRARLPTNQVQNFDETADSNYAFSNGNVDSSHNTQRKSESGEEKSIKNQDKKNSSADDASKTSDCSRSGCKSEHTISGLLPKIVQNNETNRKSFIKSISVGVTSEVQILGQEPFPDELINGYQNDYEYLFQPNSFREIHTEPLPQRRLPFIQQVEAEDYAIRTPHQTRDFVHKRGYSAERPSNSWRSFNEPFFNEFRGIRLGENAVHARYRRSFQESARVRPTMANLEIYRRLNSRNLLFSKTIEEKLLDKKNHLGENNIHFNSLKFSHANETTTTLTKKSQLRATTEENKSEQTSRNFVQDYTTGRNSNTEHGNGRRMRRSTEKVMFLTPMHGGIWTMCVDLTKEQQHNLTEQGFLMSGCVNYLGPPDPTRPDKNDWIQRMQNLSISCALVTCIILASCALVGLFGVLNRQISAVLVTGVMYILATIFAVFCLAIMHFKRRTKKDCANLDPQVSPYLNAARVFSTGWSLSMGWAGAVTCLGAALLWLLLARIMRYNPISLS